jgi:hypothetical protein
MTNESPSIEQHRREHLALAVLRVLDREPGYRLNELVLTSYFQQLGLTTIAAETRICLSLLERMGLIKSVTVEKVLVVELKEAGQDVATGRTVLEGVLRPGPECPY